MLHALSSACDLIQKLHKIVLIHANKSPLNPEHSASTAKLGQERAVSTLLRFFHCTCRSQIRKADTKLKQAIELNEKCTSDLLHFHFFDSGSETLSSLLQAGATHGCSMKEYNLREKD